MAARRSPWLNERTALLLQYLCEVHRLQISEDVARQGISDHLDFVAERMRIGRQSAKMYITDDVILEMANKIARATAAENGHAPLRLVRNED
ncbi:Uncharacterised protein [Mycobacteroides abscessus subsp. bolletii]|uniref:hypothetical protein n=1 Tax=Mycobacteroides abscessus TaxID=36809 RepID=UPI000928A623|nr:hypothetical protein [Mycobacteroides abscessus]SIJ38935.1 Uncharacterised protein [Mycobacteroides abscessus subsp. bolletii]SLE27266.1 Uncharacterised protein [Mycobacteroides abscessus subsp. bolletii]SLF14536.1 Uncharacterised protein [Mycobacteroides abscessus subsp. bolletii]